MTMRDTTPREGTSSRYFRRRTPRGNRDPDVSLNLAPQFALSIVLKILEKANVTESDQTVLLGVSPEALDHYRRGDSTLREREIVERLEDFLHCYMALKVLYARDYDMIYAWLTNPNTAIPPNPVEHMKRFGIGAVRAYLEGSLSR